MQNSENPQQNLRNSQPNSGQLVTLTVTDVALQVALQNISATDIVLDLSFQPFQGFAPLPKHISKNELLKRVLSKCPTQVFGKLSTEKRSNAQCGICLEQYKSKCLVRQLPCGHFFHSKCVKNWWKKIMQCPACRYYFECDQVYQ